jgi:hypothetical protein
MARKKLTDLDDLSKLPKNRDEARTLGIKWFFTGRPCKHGHLSARHVSSATCMECHSNRMHTVYHENPQPAIERVLKRQKELKKQDPEGFLERERIKMAEWRAANRERDLENGRNYTAINREERNEQARDRYADDPGHYRGKNKRYREKYPEAITENFRNWCRNNPDKVKVRDKNKRARRIGAEGEYDLDDLQSIGQWQNGCCIYCRSPLGKDLSIEHFIAIARGGTNWPNNIGLACIRCNTQKRDMDAIEFLIKHGYPLSCAFPREDA